MQTSQFFVHVGLAMLSALGGLFHIVYCCMFFTSGIGIVNAILLVVVAVSGLYKWRPGPKFVFYSHLALLASGTIVLVANAVGIHCARKTCSARSWSRPMQERCLQKFAETPALLQGMSRIHTAIHTLLILESSLQIIVCVVILFQTLFRFFDAVRTQLNAFYVQALLGGLAAVCGLIHTVYCSHLFFLGVGIWASVGIGLVGVVRNLCKTVNARRNSLASTKTIKSNVVDGMPRSLITIDRCLGWLAIVLSICLIIVGIFGTYCWNAVSLAPWTIGDTSIPPQLRNESQSYGEISHSFCSNPGVSSRVYETCYETLEMTGLWHRSVDRDMASIGKLQQGLTLMLLLSGVASLLLSSLIELTQWRSAAEDHIGPVSV
uniref:Transmembrane protein n=1 Tax=Plectus sambesii TaxID=2011161 RepID=A0A914UYK8_9BILA